MKNILLFIIIISTFFLIGCASKTILEARSTASYFESKPIKGEKNLDNQEKIDRYNARKARLDDLIKDYEKALRPAEVKLLKLNDQANRRSGVTLATAFIGIGAGLTATVLLVASPANAVVAAAFSGASTGILGFQNQMFMEGFSRQAIGRIHEETNDKMRAAHDKFSINYGILSNGINSMTTDDWNKYFALASSAIIDMEAETIFTRLPMGTSEDVESLKKKNEELKKTIKDLQK